MLFLYRFIAWRCFCRCSRYRRAIFLVCVPARFVKKVKRIYIAQDCETFWKIPKSAFWYSYYLYFLNGITFIYTGKIETSNNRERGTKNNDYQLCKRINAWDIEELVNIRTIHHWIESNKKLAFTQQLCTLQSATWNVVTNLILWPFKILCPWEYCTILKTLAKRRLSQHNTWRLLPTFFFFLVNYLTILAKRRFFQYNKWRLLLTFFLFS